jgi:hypothetical protein
LHHILILGSAASTQPITHFFNGDFVQTTS